MTKNNTVPLNTIVKYIEMHCPTVGAGVAELYALEAVREFCRRSQFAHRDLIVYGANGATDFELPVPEGLEVVKIQRIYHEKPCGSISDVTNLYGFREPTHLYLRNSGLDCWSEETKLQLVVSVMPTIDAQDVPAEVNDHALNIASGAVAKIVLLPSQMNGNAGMKAAEINAAVRSVATLNAHHTKLFETSIREVSHDRVWGKTHHNRGLTGKGLV